MKDRIKNYYTSEVNKIVPPKFPNPKIKRAIMPWENILLTAMTITSLAIVYLPGSYRNPIRSMVITKEVEERIDTRISRVIKTIDLYYSEKRSLYE